MRRKRKRFLPGYMTVEASLVMSTVLIVYLFILRTLLYQYDKCIWEQEVAGMAVKYGHIDLKTLEETTQLVKLKWDTEPYLLLTPQTPEWEVKGGYVIITSRDNTIISQDVQYKLWQIEPEPLLRIQRKIVMNREKKEGSD